MPAADVNPPPPGAYPVEDLARLSAGTASLLLRRATIEAEADATTCAHIVISRDVTTGVVTYSGPYPTGLEALTRAHQLIGTHRERDAAWEFKVTVAPLFSH